MGHRAKKLSTSFPLTLPYWGLIRIVAPAKQVEELEFTYLTLLGIDTRFIIVLAIIFPFLTLPYWGLIRLRAVMKALSAIAYLTLLGIDTIRYGLT